MKRLPPKHKCLVIAHRGASAVEPENTLRAFERAYKMGADGIEIDLFLTKDNKVVVTHDRNTYRITKNKKDITLTNLRELRQLDFGKKEKIPLLSEVFDHFVKKFSVINLEIKSTGVMRNGIEQKLAHLIKRFRCYKSLLVSSFNPLNLNRFKALMPKVRIGYLLCREQSFLARNRLAIRWMAPDTLNLDKNLYRDPTNKIFFDLPQPKWLWTVDSTAQMQFWLKRGVEAIITNHPDRLIEVMHERKKTTKRHRHQRKR